MITIYQAEAESIFLPFNLIGVAVQDCREWMFWVDSMRLLAGEALSLFEKPVKLLAIAYLWWPVNLYG